jgi:hypothetical protein
MVGILVNNELTRKTMTTPQFIQNYTQVIAGICLCIEKQLHSPALILIYSTMDTYSWAVSEKKPRTVQHSFESFVADYVFPNHPLPCSSTDLFAARYAILHTLTCDSDLSKRGAAKMIAYAWGADETTSLATAKGYLGQHEIITLHIEDLANALFDAILAVHEKAKIDSAVEQRLITAAGRHYKNLEKRTVEEFMQSIGKKLTV